MFSLRIISYLLCISCIILINMFSLLDVKYVGISVLPLVIIRESVVTWNFSVSWDIILVLWERYWTSKKMHIIFWRKMFKSVPILQISGIFIRIMILLLASYLTLSKLFNSMCLKFLIRKIRIIIGLNLLGLLSALKERIVV